METNRFDDQIQLWQRLTLALEKEGGHSEFITRVENIKKDKFVLEMPVRQSGRGVLSKGDDVEVSYNKKEAAYTFKASIVDLFEGESGSVEMKKEGRTRRIQRRRFVRLDVSGELRFRCLDTANPAEKGIGGENTGSLLNISAGGVLFETGASIKEGDLLIVTFSLKGKEKLENILAVVKRAEIVDDNIYLVGTEFITDENLAELGYESLRNYLPAGTGTFDDNLQKLVVQFIYRQQVDMRKKGLLT